MIERTPNKFDILKERDRSMKNPVQSILVAHVRYFIAPLLERGLLGEAIARHKT
jgi:hypothetical protein